MFPRDLGGRASTRSNAQPRSPSGGGASAKPSPGDPGMAASTCPGSTVGRIFKLDVLHSQFALSKFSARLNSVDTRPFRVLLSDTPVNFSFC